MTGLSPFPPLLDRYRNLPDPLSQRSCLRDPSSTVREIRFLALKYLRNVKSVLALHFRLGRYRWSSPNVCGIATPVARTACEACAVSWRRNRKRLRRLAFLNRPYGFTLGLKRKRI
jgi:hypothetical protein